MKEKDCEMYKWKKNDFERIEGGEIKSVTVRNQTQKGESKI